MDNISTKLTASEKEVLEFLWAEGKPLSSSEIVTLSAEKTWKPSYIHLLINSLLKKNVIRVAGIRPTTKNFARTFEPTMTREEFYVHIIKEENHLDSSSLSMLFSALLDDSPDIELINNLSDMLEKKKKELND